MRQRQAKGSTSPISDESTHYTDPVKRGDKQRHGKRRKSTKPKAETIAAWLAIAMTAIKMLDIVRHWFG